MKLNLYVAVVVVAVLFAVGAAAQDKWAGPRQVLLDAVEARAFPGFSAMVGSESDILFETAAGNFGYGEHALPHSSNQPTTLLSQFDMASCTKVMATTTLGAYLYQRGYFSLTDPVSDYLGPAYNSNNKSNVLIVNCLTHDAGFPPDPVPNYWDRQFGCSETFKEHPAENFDCSERIFKSVLEQKLVRPPGVKYVYSDLSMITMQYVLGQIVYSRGLVSAKDLLPSCSHSSADDSLLVGLRYSCYFEAALRTIIYAQLRMPNTQYLLPRSRWAVPPTRNDTWYRHAVSQGTVDDGNAYALGGIAGHAGLFSTLQDIHALMRAWLYDAAPSVINQTTATLWTTEYNHSISCRALGWSTNDPTAPDGGWDGTCGHLSTRTFLHIGYTGTQICADPDRRVFTVLLTNRVYPSGANTKIRQVRKDWNDAVVKILG